MFRKLTVRLRALDQGPVHLPSKAQNESLLLPKVCKSFSTLCPENQAILQRLNIQHSCVTTTSLFQRWPSPLLLAPVQNRQQQRCFRVSSKKDALPAWFVAGLLYLGKTGASMFGSKAKEWWQNLTPEEKAAYKRKVRRRWYILTGLLGGVTIGSFLYYQNHVQEAPITKRKRFLLFSHNQVVEMAKSQFDQLLDRNLIRIIPANEKPAHYNRVSRVMQRLLKEAHHLPKIKDLEWNIAVIDNDYKVNAHVLPCGSVFVFTGLLNACENDDQLGIVLSHELAHAIMEHTAEKTSYTYLLNAVFIYPLTALWSFLPGDFTEDVANWITDHLATQLVAMPHSEFIEKEADQVGIGLAAKACFDVREAPVIWAKMRRMCTEDLHMEWASTHPIEEGRQAQLEAMVAHAIALREECKCPRLPWTDPRLRKQEPLAKKPNCQCHREELIYHMKAS